MEKIDKSLWGRNKHANVAAKDTQRDARIHSREMPSKLTMD